MNLGTWERRQLPNLSGNNYLYKLGKEYLNNPLCKLGTFFSSAF